MNRMAPSATAAVFKRVAELRAAGIEVVSLSLGEPDFEPPPHVLAAAKAAIDGGASRYTEVAGLRALRAAICADSLRRRGVEHAVDEVVVSAGAKHSLFNLAQALFDHGDEVVIPVPAWGSYAEQVRLCGATPVLVPGAEQDGFLPRPAALAAALGPRTKAIVLCTPSNPTGAAYLPEQLSEIAQLLRGHECIAIVDEIYSELVYDGLQLRSLLTLAPDLRERIAIVDGVSKRYAMTGYRVGWMLASRPLARACEALQSQATSSISAVSQHAALAALQGDDAHVHAMRDRYAQRRTRLCAGLSAIPGLRARTPQGAFYVFVSVHGLLGRGGLTSDVDVAKHWLEHARVAVVPGSDFHAPGYVRLSYATSEEQIDLALERIAEAVAKL
jgi:aspartate aminotransferase